MKRSILCNPLQYITLPQHRNCDVKLHAFRMCPQNHHISFHFNFINILWIFKQIYLGIVQHKVIKLNKIYFHTNCKKITQKKLPLERHGSEQPEINGRS